MGDMEGSAVVGAPVVGALVLVGAKVGAVEGVKVGPRRRLVDSTRRSRCRLCWQQCRAPPCAQAQLRLAQVRCVRGMWYSGLLDHTLVVDTGLSL